MITEDEEAALRAAVDALGPVHGKRLRTEIMRLVNMTATRDLQIGMLKTKAEQASVELRVHMDLAATIIAVKDAKIEALELSAVQTKPILDAAIALARLRTEPGGFRSMSPLENVLIDAVLASGLVTP